jgi:hypothetical protein
MIEIECKSLTERLDAKRQAGLVDIKFYINAFAAVDGDEVYDEADLLLAATEVAELVEPFEFNDRHIAA